VPRPAIAIHNLTWIIQARETLAHPFKTNNSQAEQTQTCPVSIMAFRFLSNMMGNLGFMPHHRM
jgi:hypothetical protein